MKKNRAYTDEDYKKFLDRGLIEYNKGEIPRLENDEIENGAYDFEFYVAMVELGKEICEKESKNIVWKYIQSLSSAFVGFSKALYSKCFGFVWKRGLFEKIQ